MAPKTTQRDRLDEVLHELDQARLTPEWLEEEEAEPRRLVRAPRSLGEARWQPSRAAVAAVLLLALAAVAIFGVRVLLARSPQAGGGAQAAAFTSGRPSPSVSVATGTPPPSATQPGVQPGVMQPGASGQAGASAVVGANSASPVQVHVVGAVNRPGLVTVKPGARVAEAVQAAGGMAKNADPTAINLARAVQDGEQIYVTKRGEQPPAHVASTAGANTTGGANPSTGTAPPGQPGSAQPGASSASEGGTVNLNTADAAALESLPGVGPVMAQRIVEWRQQHGQFSAVDELSEVSGIGPKVLERLRPKVSV